MDDEELERQLKDIKTQRNFSRLSVHILEVALQRIDGVISDALQGFQEHVPEPEPNPNRFIGYIKYDKTGYVKTYEDTKPLRDLSRLIRTFLPSMRAMSDCLQTQFHLLMNQHEVRALRRRIAAHLNMNQAPDVPRVINGDVNGEVPDVDEPPPLENVDPIEDCN